MIINELIKLHQFWQENGIEAQYVTGSKNRTTNSRFDYEVTAEDEEAGRAPAIILEGLAENLAEILISGDKWKSHDPFLKLFDGYLVKGGRLKSFEITQAIGYKEYKPITDMYEYIIFLVLFVDWE